MSNILGDLLIESVAKKFNDTSKLANLDAQIFYLTQQIRRETAIFMRMRALACVPKLIQVLKARKDRSLDQKD